MTGTSTTSLRSAEILLVEDDMDDFKLIVMAFKKIKTPLKISLAHDGEEALEYLHHAGPYEAAAKPDLILLDLNMPRMDGFELLREIKNDLDLQQIPALVFTCSRAAEDVQRAYEARANFYMAKPTELNQFDVIVRYVEEFWLKAFWPLNRLGMEGLS